MTAPASESGVPAPEASEGTLERGRFWRSLGAVAFMLALVAASGWFVWSNWLVVPDLLGSSQGDAQAALDREGLRVGSVVATYSGDEGRYPTGTVLSHAPGPGARVSPGARIVLTVVAGPEWTTMTDLRSLTLTEAAGRLRAKDVTVSVVDPVYHVVPLSAYAYGLDLRVTATAPQAGKRLVRGGNVMLSVDRSVEATERRFVFGHPQEIYAKGIRGCYTGCHQELECSKCHLATLSGLVLPEGVTVEEVVRDGALEAAGATTDEEAPRLAGVTVNAPGVFTVRLNADAAKPGNERRERMLQSTTDLFRAVLGRVGVNDVTVRWVAKGTDRDVMRVRMTADTMRREKWTGMPAGRLPQLADSFSE